MVSPIIKSESYDPYHGNFTIEYIDGTKIEMPPQGLDFIRNSNHPFDINFLKMVDDKEKELFRLLKIQKIIQKL